MGEKAFVGGSKLMFVNFMLIFLTISSLLSTMLTAGYLHILFLDYTLLHYLESEQMAKNIVFSINGGMVFFAIFSYNSPLEKELGKRVNKFIFSYGTTTFLIYLLFFGTINILRTAGIDNFEAVESSMKITLDFTNEILFSILFFAVFLQASLNSIFFEE